MVQWSRDGAGEQRWSCGAGMELGSGDGAGERGWCCGAGMELGSRDGAVEQGWCREARMMLWLKHLAVTDVAQVQFLASMP